MSGDLAKDISEGNRVLTRPIYDNEDEPQAVHVFLFVRVDKSNNIIDVSAMVMYRKQIRELRS